MCARFTVRRLLDALRFGVDYQAILPFEAFSETRIAPRFNIGPAQAAVIVRLNNEGKRSAHPVQWGLIPHWTRGKPKIAPINAKSETAATNGMFRQAMEQRRCLIPADGFYEPAGPKTMKHRPWYFFQIREAQPFCFGGLWERWKPAPDAEPVDTFTILTTSPNAVVGQFHDRMPLILQQYDFARWLDRDIKADDVTDLLKPYPVDDMESWRVGDAAKKMENDGPELIEPLTD